MSLLIFSIALMVSAPALAAESKEDKEKAKQAKLEKERQEVRKAAQEILGRLYKAEPSAKAAVEKAAGYATFSNFGMKILVAGTGKGKGLAVDNQTKKQTFMKMFEVQAGLGFGVKKFSLIWVFETPETFATFVNSGWEMGGQTSAAAKAGEKGASIQGAVAVSPGVWLYQLTDAGLALELTVKGTKYSKDDDLN
jgi:lipid-binding SYLF domain-containing protein